MHSSTPISQSLLTNHNSRRDSNMELLRIVADKLRILLWKMILFLLQRVKPNQEKQFAGGIKTEVDTPKIEQQANHKEEY